MAKKLLDRLKDKIRFIHYSPKTEASYVSWVRRFILFHDKQHPKDTGKLRLRLNHCLTFFMSKGIL